MTMDDLNECKEACENNFHPESFSDKRSGYDVPTPKPEEK